MVDTLLNTVLLVPTLVVMVLLFGAVLRRLLGVRVGVVRTLLAALFGLLLAGPLVQALLPDPVQTDTGTSLLVVIAAACCASVLAMIVLVLAEVLVPDGSLPGPVEIWRGGRTRVRRTRRYAEVVGIAVRHGLGRFLRGRGGGLESPAARRQLAVELRRALDEGGVTFVKLGQQLSTRRDLVSSEVADELTRLQDQAAPVAWEEVSAVLERELGRPCHEVFAQIDPQPIAAASVAQVHAGRLPDGTEVVVKVQRPAVAAVVERDLDIVLRLARTLENRTGWARAVRLRSLADGFAEALREELDFTIERDNMRAAAVAVAGSAARSIRVPVPLTELCSARVLVMDRLPGSPLGSAGTVLTALSQDRRRALARDLLGSMLDQVLDHGLFHVDPHPGNVLLSSDGTLGLLDFGSVGRLDRTTRRATGLLLGAVGRGDSAAATDALLELVDRPDQVDERELERTIGALVVRYAAPGSSAGAAAFAALFRLVTSNRLGVPPQVAAMFRAFATLEGTLAVLDPHVDLVSNARDLGGDRLAQALAPARLREAVEEELVTLLPLVRRLPRRLDRIADAVEHGRVGVNVRLLADDRDRRVVTDLLHQTLLTVLGASAGLMAVLLLGIPGGPWVTEGVRLFALLGYALLIVSVVLVLRVLVIIFRRDPG